MTTRGEGIKWVLWSQHFANPQHFESFRQVGRNLDRSVNAQFLDPEAESARVEFKDRGGPGRPVDSPTGLLENPQDVFAFGAGQVLQGFVAGADGFGGPQLFGQSESTPGGDDHTAFDHVLQLPHIARPVVLQEHLDRGFRNAFDMPAHLTAIFFHEVPGERRNILAPLPEGRDR